MLLKIIIIVLIISQVNAFKNLTCHDLLRELSNNQMMFIHCVTTNSAPVTMCSICQVKYVKMLMKYDDLSSNPNCSAMYFDKDRINMVASTESALTGLWSKAYCDDCYNNNNKDIFYEKNETLKDCFLAHNKDACEECVGQYLDLNNFYIKLDQHNNGEVCYDLQDSMNRTRNYWSKVLKCCRREYDMTLFAVALSIISCLPFTFYGCTYLLTKRQERNHGILNDEDPIFNSSTPSTSATTTMNINNNPSSSGVSNSNTAAAQPVDSTKKVFNLLNDDSSDGEDAPNLAVDVAYKTKEKFK